MHYRNLSKQILWHSNRQHETATVIHHLLSGPRHPILHSNVFFYVKLFATIILSWNLFKCILGYLFQLSDPFFLNENSVLAGLIETFEQNLLSLENEAFFKEGKSDFFD